MSSEAAKRATRRIIELLFHGRVKSLESNPVVAIIDSELEAERAAVQSLKEALTSAYARMRELHSYGYGSGPEERKAEQALAEAEKAGI